MEKSSKHQCGNKTCKKKNNGNAGESHKITPDIVFQ